MEEVKEQEPTNGKEHAQEEVKAQEPVTDFKVAEIHIKSGQVFLEGSQEFWMDRVRALGLLELCKDIVKTAKMPEPEQPKIITSPGVGPLQFMKNRLRNKKR